MMVTTRAIEANEELKWSYGTSYWFAALGFKEAEKRIASYVMRQPKAKREQMMVLLKNMKEVFEASKASESK
jgi:hypothetical protein